MKKLNDWMETHLPWGVNNGIKWVAGMPFYVIYVVVIFLWDLRHPITRGFWDGSTQLGWFMEWDWPWMEDE